MRAKALTLAALALTLGIGQPMEAHAGKGSVSGQSSGDGTTQIVVSDVINGSAGPGSGSDSCVWAFAGSLPAFVDGHTTKIDGDVISVLWTVTCGDKLTLVWVPIITPKLLAQSLRDQVERILPRPAPHLIPTSAWQFASWPTSIMLPVGDTTMAPLTASIPGLSATLRPTLAAVTFNPGNDEDTVICPKIPIAKEDCVYTYPHSSKDAPDQKFPASITTTWTLPYTASNGATGTIQPPIVLTTPINIPVARIQVTGGS